MTLTDYEYLKEHSELNIFIDVYITTATLTDDSSSSIIRCGLQIVAMIYAQK